MVGVGRDVRGAADRALGGGEGRARRRGLDLRSASEPTGRSLAARGDLASTLSTVTGAPTAVRRAGDSSWLASLTAKMAPKGAAARTTARNARLEVMPTGTRLAYWRAAARTSPCASAASSRES